MADQPAPPAQPREKTKYQILRFTNEGGDKEPPKYALVGRDFAAHNSDQAIRDYVATKGNKEGGLFVAVPDRSWQPVSVKVETQTVVKLGEAA